MRISVCSVHEVASLARALRPDAIVSILLQREWMGHAHPDPSVPSLHLPVLDTGPYPITPGNWEGGTLRPPRTVDVERLLSLGRDMQGKESHVLVHCHAASSRSPAAALLLAAQEDGPGNEESSYRRLMLACPRGVYLTGEIVALGDTLLQREGRLLGIWLAALRLSGAHGPITMEHLDPLLAGSSLRRP